jgi:hypothetical protein
LVKKDAIQKTCAHLGIVLSDISTKDNWFFVKRKKNENTLIKNAKTEAFV